MNTTPLYVKLWSASQARVNSAAAGRMKVADAWEAWIKQVCEEMLPSGSGFDHGTTCLLQDITGPLIARRPKDVIVLRTSFHHMNDNGRYVKWTSHTIRVTPTFGGIDLRITGENYRGIKDYIAETMHQALTFEPEAYPEFWLPN